MFRKIVPLVNELQKQLANPPQAIIDTILIAQINWVMGFWMVTIWVDESIPICQNVTKIICYNVFINIAISLKRILVQILESKLLYEATQKILNVFKIG